MIYLIKFLSLISLFFLVGCETPQKKQARSMCSQIAYKKFPVEKVSYSCVKTIYKNVEKGEKCTTKRIPSLRIGEYDLETVCKKIIKEEPFYENATCVSDKNERARRNWTYNCANQACLKTYGNKDCE